MKAGIAKGWQAIPKLLPGQTLRVTPLPWLPRPMKTPRVFLGPIWGYEIFDPHEAQGDPYDFYADYASHLEPHD